MPRVRSPRKSSMGVWPRKRATQPRAKVRSWSVKKEIAPLGFPGFKAGMTQVTIEDNIPNSITKGDNIVIPTTIIECPPITVCGITFYKNTINGLSSCFCVLSPQQDKNLSRSFPLPNLNKVQVSKTGQTSVAKQKTTIDEVSLDSFDDLRLLVHTQPKDVQALGRKSPDVFELAVSGSKEKKLEYAKSVLGKTISIEDIFKPGEYVDARAVTKGKGLQGPVKRFGVAIRHHKSEKTKRGPGSLGPWHGTNYHRVAKAGQMGYHQRVDYNKLILSIEKEGKKVTPIGGFLRYGVVKNSCLLIKGSLPGPKKRMILLTQAIRPNKNVQIQAPVIVSVSQRSQQ
ncbi:50S ribosomal protein L3 [Candidatus Woesearchaeota archaeon]|nr:50S ribosomal protein L3 [Candidatus Woesearchaeota archaeon]